MSSLLRGWFGLRGKLLLLSALLLVIPYLGYQYILEMEQYLSRGQEQVVLGTARALATALSERPELFNNGNYSRSRSGSDLYVYPTFAPLLIDDGSLADWGDYQQYEQSYSEGSSTPYSQNRYTSFRAEDSGDPLNFRLMLAEYNRMLYFYVKAEDSHPVLRQRDSLRLDRSDALQITLENREGEFERYLVAPYDNEFLYVFRIDDGERAAYIHEPRITGRFHLTETGYEYEVRLPLEMVGDKFGVALYDVDDPRQRVLEALVATSGVERQEELGSLRRPTPEIDRIVAGMGHTNSRVRVVDRNQRVLLSTGDIESASGLLLVEQEKETGGAWGRLREDVLHPLYSRILTRPSDRFMNELYETGVVEGDQVLGALDGTEQSGFITLQDGITRLLEAAWPVMADGQVLGAVVVDQNMNGIRTFRNQALETLFDTMIGILLLTVSALFLFASSLSSRIRSLRNQAEKVVDERGRLNQISITPSRSADEIGDLSRSFANLVERLGQYTQYLENLSSRLSHELRTPVTVVRSSLENLRLCNDEPEAELYIQRAEEGLSRLSRILSNMSEASRLEQILRESDKEAFRLDQVVRACVAEYRQIYPDTAFNAEFAPVTVEGTPEYIAQMMDKIVANAVDYSPVGKPVRISCKAEGDEAVISVINQGPYLDPRMKDRMFESMVSARTSSSGGVPHLGLGLHIARMITEYHGGRIYADNLSDEQGVSITIRLPARRSS